MPASSTKRRCGSIAMSQPPMQKRVDVIQTNQTNERQHANRYWPKGRAQPAKYPCLWRVAGSSLPIGRQQCLRIRQRENDEKAQQDRGPCPQPNAAVRRRKANSCRPHEFRKRSEERRIVQGQKRAVLAEQCC